MFKKALKLPILERTNQKEVDELDSMGVKISFERRIVWSSFYSISVVEDNPNYDPEDPLSPKCFIYSGYYYFEGYLFRSEVDELIEKHNTESNE